MKYKGLGCAYSGPVGTVKMTYFMTFLKNETLILQNYIL